MLTLISATADASGTVLLKQAWRALAYPLADIHTDLRLFVCQAMEHYAKFDVHAAQRHVAPAVLGFFRSVALGQASG